MHTSSAWSSWPTASITTSASCPAGDPAHGFDRILAAAIHDGRRAHLFAHRQPRGDLVDADDLAGPQIADAGVEHLADRPLPDDRDVFIEQAGQLLQREDHRPQRLGQQRLLGRAALIERDGALFADAYRSYKPR